MVLKKVEVDILCLKSVSFGFGIVNLIFILFVYRKFLLWCMICMLWYREIISLVLKLWLLIVYIVGIGKVISCFVSVMNLVLNVVWFLLGWFLFVFMIYFRFRLLEKNFLLEDCVIRVVGFFEVLILFKVWLKVLIKVVFYLFFFLFIVRIKIFFLWLIEIIFVFLLVFWFFVFGCLFGVWFGLLSCVWFVWWCLFLDCVYKICWDVNCS